MADLSCIARKRMVDGLPEGIPAAILYNALALLCLGAADSVTKTIRHYRQHLSHGV